MLAAHRYSSSQARGAVAVALPRLCLISCMYSSSRSSVRLMPCRHGVQGLAFEADTRSTPTSMPLGRPNPVRVSKQCHM